jgi:DNA-binding IclR family transcriptional regulator
LAQAQALKIGSVDKALDILELLCADGKGFTLSQIAHHLQLHPSTVHHLLTTMRARGFVTQDAQSRVYRAGHRLVHLVLQYLRHTDLYSAGLQPIRELRDLSGEMSFLNAYHGCEIDSVIQMVGWRPIQCHRFTRPGETTLHSTATGKLLLAHLPHPRVRGLLTSLRLTKFTSNTIADPDNLLAELELIRCRGYAVDREENLEGVMCVAAPIFNGDGECVGSASVAFPSAGEERVKELVRLVVEAANKISANLGRTEKA